LKEVTEAVKPPRTLFVDRPLGFPLGLPDQPQLQTEIIQTALRLLMDSRELPLIDDFDESKR
jgi:hypothetical protein